MGLRITGTSRFGHKIATLIAMFALVAQPMYGLVAGQIASAATIDVCETGCEYASIQAAINAASTNDTIRVAAGTYTENLDINKHINLIGAGAKSTTIVNRASGEYTIFMNNHAASGSDIKGFTLKNEAYDEPVLKLADHATLDNLYVTGNHFYSNNAHLIYAGNVTNSNFTSNTFYVDGINNTPAKRAGVYFGPSSNGNTFKNNKFTGSTDSMPFGIHGDNNKFLLNDLSGLTTTYNKVFEVAGSGNEDLGSNVYGPHQVAINPGSNKFRGIYSTISSAVSVAQSGDTVNMSPGTYVEALNIEKSINLIGAGRSVSTIKAPTSFSNGGDLISIKGSGVSVNFSNFSVDGISNAYKNGGAGMHAFNGAIVNIDDVGVEHVRNEPATEKTLYGILIGGSASAATATITNSYVGDYQRGGIYVMGKGTKASLKNNTIEANPLLPGLLNGISVQYGADAKIIDNTIKGNTYSGTGWSGSGISIWDDPTNWTEIRDNTVTGNETGLGLVTKNADVLENIVIDDKFENNGTNARVDSASEKLASLNYWPWDYPKEVFYTNHNSYDQYEIVMHDGKARVFGYDLLYDDAKPMVKVELSSTLFGATSPVPEVTVTASDNLSGIDRVEYKVMQNGANVKGYGWTEVTNDTATPAPQLRDLPSGDYTLVARAFDNAGNKRSGIEVDFTVDNTGPTATLEVTGLKDVNGSSYVRPGDKIKFEVTANDTESDLDRASNIVFKLKENGKTQNGSVCGSWHNGKFDAGSNVRTASYTMKGCNGGVNPADGLYGLALRVYDKAGNNVRIPNKVYAVDGTKPTVSEFEAPSTVSKELTLSAEAEDKLTNGVASGVQSVKFYLAEVQNGVCKNNYSALPGYLRTVAYQANGEYSVSFDTSALNGEYCVLVSARDNVANNSTPLFKKVMIDNTAPTAKLTTDTSQPFSGMMDLKFEVDDYDGSGVPSPREGSQGVYYKLKNAAGDIVSVQTENNGKRSTLWMTTDGSQWSSQYGKIDTNSMNDGKYTIVGRAIDNAGNVSHFNNLGIIVIDNTGPDVESVVLNGQDVTNNLRAENCDAFKRIYLVSGEFDLAATIKDEHSEVAKSWFMIRKVKDNGCSDAAIYSDDGKLTDVDNDDTWTGSYQTDGATDSKGHQLEDGIYTVQIMTRDSQGNQNYVYVDIEVDNTAPDQPEVLGMYKGHNSDAKNFVACGGHTNDTRIRISWEPVVDAEYYWFGVASKPKHKKVTKTYYDGNMTPGRDSYYYTVIAVDAAGNESEISNQCNVTLDREAPDVEILGAELSSENQIEFTGTVDDTNFEHYYCWLTRTTGGEVGKRGENCVTTWASDLQRNGNPATSLKTGTNGEELLGQFDITGLEDGEYIIHMGAKDRAGNLNTTASYLFTVDRSEYATQPPAEDGAEDGADEVTKDETEEDVVVQGAFTNSPNPFNSQRVGESAPTPSAFGPSSFFFAQVGVDNSMLETGDQDGSADKESKAKVLGEEDDTAEVSNTGNTDGEEEVSEGCYDFLGLCWYWWVAIVAGVAIVAYVLMRPGREDTTA